MQQLCSRIAVAVAVVLTMAIVPQVAAARQDLVITPFKATGIYARGERVGWTLTRSAERIHA